MDTRSRLEEIALLGSDSRPLDDCWVYRSEHDNPEFRLERYKGELDNPRADSHTHYLIRMESEIIGFASVSDGWNPSEMDYDEPYVNLAVLHPNHVSHAGPIRQRLQEILEELKKTRG
jgi:hypothetical protein